MGGANSTVKLVNDTTVINNTQIDVLNESITDIIADTNISQAAQCGSTNIQNQTITFNNIISEGDITIGPINQYQNSSLDFSCTSTQDVRNNVSNDLFRDIRTSIYNSNTTEILARLNGQADSNIKKGLLPGFADSNADVENIVDWTVENSVYSEIDNVIKTSIQNNFTVNNLQQCNTNLVNSQGVHFTALQANGDITIHGITQTQSADTYSTCILEQNVANDMTTQITDVIGVEVEVVNRTETEAEQIGEGSAEASKGFLSSIGCNGRQCCIFCICCICLIVLILLSAGFAYMKSK